mgnify:CR=1 FL=1
MKIIKKILAFFNILVICGCFLSVINANAEESASVLISSANGVVGEKINITVTIEYHSVSCGNISESVQFRALANLYTFSKVILVSPRSIILM